MSQTLKNFRLNLNEDLKKLQEIGERVPPYETDFVFSNKPGIIYTSFKDDQNNTIRVQFHSTSTKTKSYEVEFDINGYSKEAFKTNMKHFFKIISTVVEIINEFIEKYKPYQLDIEPYEKTGKIDQKDKIWAAYASVNIKDKNYIMGKSPNGFSIQINTNK